MRLRAFRLLAIFLVIVVFSRAVFQTGDFSLYEVLVAFESFDFDFEYIENFLEVFDRSFTSTLFRGWDHSLSGIDGFFANVGAFFEDLGNAFVIYFNAFFTVQFDIIEAFFGFFADIINLVRVVLGI